jgi:hypothetical protein
VDIILPFFDHLPTSTWTFFTLRLDDIGIFDHPSSSSSPHSF